MQQLSYSNVNQLYAKFINVTGLRWKGKDPNADSSGRQDEGIQGLENV